MNNEAVRKIAVTGSYNTYYITLPKDMIKSLKWKKGEKKVIVRKGREIVIKDWKPR